MSFRSAIQTVSRSQALRVAARPAPFAVARPNIGAIRHNTNIPKDNAPVKSNNLALWGGAALVGAAGIYYFLEVRNSSAVGAYKAVKEGDLAEAGHRAYNAVTGQYPGLRQTLNYLVGKDVGESVSKTLESLQQASQTANNSDAGKKLKVRAKEVESNIRDLLKEAMANKENAMKELGPSAKKHYDAVVASFKDTNEGVWGKLENSLQALKSEGSKFADEAKHSDVGEKLRSKLQDLLSKAEDIKKEGEKLSAEVKK